MSGHCKGSASVAAQIWRVFNHLLEECNVGQYRSIVGDLERTFRNKFANFQASFQDEKEELDRRAAHDTVALRDKTEEALRWKEKFLAKDKVHADTLARLQHTENVFAGLKVDHEDVCGRLNPLTEDLERSRKAHEAEQAVTTTMASEVEALNRARKVAEMGMQRAETQRHQLKAANERLRAQVKELIEAADESVQVRNDAIAEARKLASELAVFNDSLENAREEAAKLGNQLQGQRVERRQTLMRMKTLDSKLIDLKTVHANAEHRLAEEQGVSSQAALDHAALKRDLHAMEALVLKVKAELAAAKKTIATMKGRSAEEESRRASALQREKELGTALEAANTALSETEFSRDAIQGRLDKAKERAAEAGLDKNHVVADMDLLKKNIDQVRNKLVIANNQIADLDKEKRRQASERARVEGRLKETAATLRDEISEIKSAVYVTNKKCSVFQEMISASESESEGTLKTLRGKEQIISRMTTRMGEMQKSRDQMEELLIAEQRLSKSVVDDLTELANQVAKHAEQTKASAKAALLGGSSTPRTPASSWADGGDGGDGGDGRALVLGPRSPVPGIAKLSSTDKAGEELSTLVAGANNHWQRMELISVKIKMYERIAGSSYVALGEVKAMAGKLAEAVESSRLKLAEKDLELVRQRAKLKRQKEGRRKTAASIEENDVARDEAAKKKAEVEMYNRALQKTLHHKLTIGLTWEDRANMLQHDLDYQVARCAGLSSTARSLEDQVGMLKRQVLSREPDSPAAAIKKSIRTSILFRDDAGAAKDKPGCRSMGVQTDDDLGGRNVDQRVGFGGGAFADRGHNRETKRVLAHIGLANLRNQPITGKRHEGGRNGGVDGGSGDASGDGYDAYDNANDGGNYEGGGGGEGGDRFDEGVDSRSRTPNRPSGDPSVQSGGGPRGARVRGRSDSGQSQSLPEGSDNGGMDSDVEGSSSIGGGSRGGSLGRPSPDPGGFQHNDRRQRETFESPSPMLPSSAQHLMAGRSNPPREHGGSEGSSPPRPSVLQQPSSRQIGFAASEGTSLSVGGTIAMRPPPANTQLGQGGRSSGSPRRASSMGGAGRDGSSGSDNGSPRRRPSSKGGQVDGETTHEKASIGELNAAGSQHDTGSVRNSWEKPLLNTGNFIPTNPTREHGGSEDSSPRRPSVRSPSFGKSVGGSRGSTHAPAPDTRTYTEKAFGGKNTSTESIDTPAGGAGGDGDGSGGGGGTNRRPPPLNTGGRKQSVVTENSRRVSQQMPPSLTGAIRRASRRGSPRSPRTPMGSSPRTPGSGGGVELSSPVVGGGHAPT